MYRYSNFANRTICLENDWLGAIGVLKALLWVWLEEMAWFLLVNEHWPDWCWPPQKSQTWDRHHLSSRHKPCLLYVQQVLSRNLEGLLDKICAERNDLPDTEQKEQLPWNDTCEKGYDPKLSMESVLLWMIPEKKIPMWNKWMSRNLDGRGYFGSVNKNITGNDVTICNKT